MSENVHVEAARIPDRDRLLEELRAAGLDARPVADEAAVEVLAHAESVIMRTGSSFVPIKHEGTIYIRPPLS